MTSSFTWDIVLAGPVFFDYGFAGLGGRPSPGTEVYASTVGISPGGIANLAIACARLGMRTSMAASFGDDVFGAWCRASLEREGVDLSASRTVAGLPTSVTVAVAYDGDRSMITYEDSSIRNVVTDVPAAQSARALVADLGALRGGEDSSWWRESAARGTRIFADIGWDSAELWSDDDLAPLAYCDTFTPNEREALAYTRTSDALSAARALATRVPRAIVTCGSAGAVAVEAATGTEISVPGLAVDAVDPTGAGDVFTAALVCGSLFELPLAEEVAFAVLCSGIAVTRNGSALSAPSWGDIAAWWDANRNDPILCERYAFLTRIIPQHPGSPAAPAPDRLHPESIQYLSAPREES